MSTDVQEHRRARLVTLLKDFKKQGKSVAQLAKEYPVDPSFISQLKNKHRGFGEDAARNLEQALDLEPFYFEPYFDQLKKTIQSDDRLSHLDAISRLSSPELMEETNKGLEDMEAEFPMYFIADVIYISKSEQGQWEDCREAQESYRENLIVISSSVSVSAYAVLFETDEFFPVIRAGWIGVFDPAYGNDSGDLTHIVLKDGTHLLKEYLYSKGDRLFFESLNSDERDSFLSNEIDEMASLRSLMHPDSLTMKVNPS
ncbi:hypothetical protein R0I52_06290 [Psychrobacter sp. CAM01]|uniref:hypothetical protein n=1 Tax=Psychrobacter sp. CAM01 TaxID=3080335 RepID=UPI0029357A18|nr:hypothetical protein [Psychrobacter sp. CAM01]MDV2860317.1 hypothetical protein [Psychrobacter sp. CAM01]